MKQLNSVINIISALKVVTSKYKPQINWNQTDTNTAGTELRFQQSRQHGWKLISWGTDAPVNYAVIIVYSRFLFLFQFSYIGERFVTVVLLPLEVNESFFHISVHKISYSPVI